MENVLPLFENRSTETSSAPPNVLIGHERRRPSRRVVYAQCHRAPGKYK